MTEIESSLDLPTPFAERIDLLAKQINNNATRKGFWDDASPLAENEKLLLIHSEISELVEDRRKEIHTAPSEKITQFTREEEEMADVIIRALDYAAQRGMRIGGAILAKHNYNIKRPHMHGKKF